MSTTTPDEPEGRTSDTEVVATGAPDQAPEAALAEPATQQLPVTPDDHPAEPETLVLPTPADASWEHSEGASARTAAPRGVPLEKAPVTEQHRPTSSAPPVEAPAITPAPAEAQHARRRMRVSTVVWGLMLAAVGVWIIAWAGGARIDVQLALIVLLAAGGAALLVGSIVSGARHSRR